MGRPGWVVDCYRNLVAVVRRSRSVHVGDLAELEPQKPDFHGLELEIERRELEYENCYQAASKLARQEAIRSLAVVAHELRNPICCIRNAIEILGRDHSVDAPKARLIIERQVGELSRMVDDLMDLSRAGTGKLAVILETVCLRDIIERTRDLCAPALNRRRQRLLVSGSGFEESVNADPLRILQVLGNLLDNASKYSPDCSAIHLDLQVLPGDVRLSIRDYGIGVSCDALGLIFEPFAQEARAMSLDRSGLGVGLSVVRDLIEAHGGTVRVHSDGIGRGATFVVTLPR